MANVTPWAQVQGTQAPLIPAMPPDAGPGVWAPIPDQSAAPNVPMAPPQQAVYAPTPEQHRLDQDQAKLQKVRMAEARPFGFQGAAPSTEFPEGLAPNHPGIGGKIAHVFSRIGNIAGDIVAPNVMARIPGTEMGNQAQEQNLTNRVGQEETGIAENKQRNATTAATEAEVPLREAQTEVAQNEAANAPAMSSAEIAEHNAHAASLLHPQAKTDFEAWQQQNPNKPIEEWLKALSANKTEKPDPARQQLVDEYQKQHPGASLAKANEYASAALQAPQRAPVIQMFMPDPNKPGNEVLTPIRAGQSIGPGGQTAAGLNSMNTPTAQSRNMAEMAGTVLPQMQNVKNEVDQMSAAIGPAAGRWNQLMVNKGGVDYPQFAKLDTELDLLASAIVRTHFGARGGQGYREELKKMFGEAQSPEDLKARIDGANGFIQGYARMGGNQGAPQASEPIVQHSASTGQYRYSTDGGATWQTGQPNQPKR